MMLTFTTQSEPTMVECGIFGGYAADFQFRNRHTIKVSWNISSNHTRHDNANRLIYKLMQPITQNKSPKKLLELLPLAFL